MTNLFALAMTAVQPAATVLHVPVSSGGLEIRGIAAVRAREGLSGGAVRGQGTEGAALPAVARMPHSHDPGSGEGPRGDGLRLV